jgi:NAD(P)-dependent dehydrogenase (short-subunit alcohol dehydrogenase family)
VVGIAREGPRAAEAFAQLGAEVGTARVELVSADLGDLAAVRRAAAAIAARHGAVHALAHNAGALDDAFRASASGVEQTVASQVVGPFLLTQLLRPQLRAAAPSRVVWVSSGGMYAEALDVAKLAMTASSYDGVSAYARAKRAQITLSELLAERLRHDGVVVHAMHPGWADTPGVARSLPTFRALVGPLLRTPDEGAETLVWLLAGVGAPLDRTGLFWLDRRPRPTHKLARTRRADTPEERAKLWAWVVRESGWEGEA